MQLKCKIKPAVVWSDQILKITEFQTVMQIANRKVLHSKGCASQNANERGKNEESTIIQHLNEPIVDEKGAKLSDLEVSSAL